MPGIDRKSARERAVGAAAGIRRAPPGLPGASVMSLRIERLTEPPLAGSDMLAPPRAAALAAAPAELGATPAPAKSGMVGCCLSCSPTASG
jgi:hypothetical protein